jgi:RNA polymerase sigma-70 factor (ECF subfamily)
MLRVCGQRIHAATRKKTVADGNYYLQRKAKNQVLSLVRDTAATEEPSDLDLVRSAASGSAPAFHRLVDRHAKRLFRVAMSMTATRSDAEDLLQETLIGAFRGLKNFRGRSSVRTWLLSILMRQAAKGWHRSRFVRRTRWIGRAGGGEGDDDGQAPCERDDSALVIRPSTSASDQRMDFYAVLDELPPHHRQIIVLREIEQLSYDEMATALGIPRGTVESRVHRARLQLRELLRDYMTDAPQAAKGANHAAL